MKQLPLNPYWEKIVDYYYDYVHYERKITIQKWIKEKYNASIVLDRRWISFEKESDLTMFLLRWS